LLIPISISCFAEKSINNPNLFMDKIEFFYIDSNPTVAKEIIKEAADFNWIENISGVIAAFAREYPKEIVKWISDNHIKFEEHPSMINALYLGGMQEEAFQLALKAHLPAQEILPLGNKARSFLDISANFSGAVQYMCSHFYISGDVRYGKKIIDILEFTSSQVKTSEELKNLKEEAEIVLRDLVFKHDRIYQLLLNESKIRKGSAQATLNLILEDLHQQQKKCLVNEENLFKGMILVTDNGDFEKQWWDLPVMSGSFGKAISSIPYPKQETIVMSYILFTGCELDKGLNAHVTYDAEIYEPQGTKISECHYAPAIQCKIPSRFLVQKADQPIGLKFEACSEKDEEAYLPGTYTIKVSLKDHISKKEIKLSQTFELLPEKANIPSGSTLLQKD